MKIVIVAGVILALGSAFMMYCCILVGKQEDDRMKEIFGEDERRNNEHED